MILNNTSSALKEVPEVYTSKVIPCEVVKGKLSRKNEIRYNKDGSVCQIKNHKEAGKDSEVYAFRTEEEITAMLNTFDKHIAEAENETQRQIASRNKLLFLIGINIGIRASDLRTMKWNFFYDQKSDGTWEWKPFYVLQPMKQKKQKKFVKLFFNETVRTAVEKYLSAYPEQNQDDYVFPSRKGNEPITVSSLCRIVKDAAEEAGIKQNIGSHSLRKTWGFFCFHEAEDKNKALVILQQCFGHSSTQVTLRYIGLMDDEIEDMYNSVNLGLEYITESYGGEFNV